MIRDLLMLLSAATIIVIGTDYFHVSPGWLVLAVLGLWSLGHGLAFAYSVWTQKRKEKAAYEAWQARRAEGIRKLDEAARAAARTNRVRLR